MADKRKDNKGRNLYPGEYQDKDGRYCYHYKDANGKKCKVYSWRLNSSDKTPKGRKSEKCLRELEAEITYNLNHGIDNSKAKKYTVDDLFEDRIRQGEIKRKSTEDNYRYMYEKFIKPVFGNRKIESIKHTDVFNFYEEELYSNQGFHASTVGNVNTILSPIFNIAIIEEVITYNPCVTAWKAFSKKHKTEVSKNNNRRHSLERDQQKAFMDFVKANKAKYERWYNILVVFLGVGCRVGELDGLTWQDINFKENTITIDHQLHYGANEEGHFERYITPPKTINGNRVIEMYPEVRAALLSEKQRQMREGIFCRSVISGYKGSDGKDRTDVVLTDFVFLNRFGEALLPSSTNKAFERIRKDYNEFEKELAKREGREPIEMPHFTNHVLRHTSCTRGIQAGIPIDVQAERGGHDVETLLRIYNDVQKERRKSVVEETKDKILIG